MKILQNNKYQLYNDDCSKVLSKLEDESIDLVVTSPPYDNLRTYNGNIDQWDFEKFKTIAKELFRIMKIGGVVVWVVGDSTVNGSETGTSFKQALYFKEIGFNIHDTMIWEKPTFTATGSLAIRYAPVFEYMFVFSRGRPKTFNPIKDRPTKSDGEQYHGTVRQNDGNTKQVCNSGKLISKFGQRFNVWHIAGVHSKTERTGHPAQFPIRLAQDHIISWSNEDDIILDPFMGSGTTGVACLNTSRKFIGIEIDEKYFNIAKQRIETQEFYTSGW